MSSCLPTDALSHFEQREQELLALNNELEQKKAQALSEASNAVRDAESSSMHTRSFRPPTIPDDLSSSSWGGDATGLRRPSMEPEGFGHVPPLSRPLTGSAAHSASDGGEALHTTIRYQNTRIISLQEELDKAHAEASSRDAELQQLRLENKRLSEESRRLQDAAGPAAKQEDRMKKQLSSAEAKMHNLEQERADLLKVKTDSDLQQRKFEAEKSTKQARIDRLTEECEKLKLQLKDSSGQDRDRTTSDRKEMDRLMSEVRKLERQRTELVSAFKKQMKLIEVLKRQRAHMEAARVLSFTEDEFIRILELGDKLDE